MPPIFLLFQYSEPHATGNVSSSRSGSREQNARGLRAGSSEWRRRCVRDALHSAGEHVGIDNRVPASREEPICIKRSPVGRETAFVYADGSGRRPLSAQQMCSARVVHQGEQWTASRLEYKKGAFSPLRIGVFGLLLLLLLLFPWNQTQVNTQESSI